MEHLRDQLTPERQRAADAFPRFSAPRELEADSLVEGRPSAPTSRPSALTPPPPIPEVSAVPPSIWRRNPSQAPEGQARHLADFMDTIAHRPGPAARAHAALERALHAVSADAGAVITSGEVIASIGVGSGPGEIDQILAVGSGAVERVDLPHLGGCAAIAEPPGIGAGTTLVVARSWTDTFNPSERMMLRSMAAALGLAMAGDRPEAAAPNQSIGFLERVSQIQKHILDGSPLQETLEMICRAATAQLGCRHCAIRLAESSAEALKLVASVGSDPDLISRLGRIAPADGLGDGERIAEGDGEGAVTELAARGIVSAHSVPIPGAVHGRISVGSRSEGEVCGPVEGRFLEALAELTGLAVGHVRALERAERETLRDPVTGLPNRDALLELTDAALTAGRGGDRAPALLVLQIRGIRSIAEDLGHFVADTLVRNIAARFAPVAAEDGTLARPDEGHFAVLIGAGRTAADIDAIAAELISALSEPFELGARTVALDVCIGVSRIGGSAGELMQNAEQALRRAQFGGSRSVAYFDPTVRSQAVDRLELQAELERAIDQDQLTLHYQPLFDLIEGEITGFEALVRWENPERGLIMPDQFIGLAEDSGLILPLGRWVLGRAAKDAAALVEASGRPVRIGVNISGVQLVEDSLIDDVEWALSEADLDPSCLYLEITESVLIEDTEANIDRLERLRQIGTPLAIDDFGMGHSALKYLPGFPLDMLKIDRYFVSKIGSGEEEPVVRAIVTLANELGLEIIAEGIERPDQPEPLVEMGCRIGQGRSLCPPVPLEEAASFLIEWDQAADEETSKSA